MLNQASVNEARFEILQRLDQTTALETVYKWY